MCPRWRHITRRGARPRARHAASSSRSPLRGLCAMRAITEKARATALDRLPDRNGAHPESLPAWSGFRQRKVPGRARHRPHRGPAPVEPASHQAPELPHRYRPFAWRPGRGDGAPPQCGDRSGEHREGHSGRTRNRIDPLTGRRSGQPSGALNPLRESAQPRPGSALTPLRAARFSSRCTQGAPRPSASRRASENGVSAGPLVSQRNAGDFGTALALDRDPLERPEQSPTEGRRHALNPLCLSCSSWWCKRDPLWGSPRCAATRATAGT
jgi:hypothetical protein